MHRLKARLFVVFFQLFIVCQRSVIDNDNEEQMNQSNATNIKLDEMRHYCSTDRMRENQCSIEYSTNKFIASEQRIKHNSYR